MTLDLILFHNHGNCDVPASILTREESSLLDKKGHFPEKMRFRWIDLYDFPGIFYDQKEVSYFGYAVPRYVQTLFRHPIGWHIGTWFHDNKKERDSIQQLQQDLEEFPFDFFYDSLFQLRNVSVIYNPRLKTRAQALPERENQPRKIEFGLGSARYLTELDYIACTLLHELYHQIEFGHRKMITGLFQDHSRWKIERVAHDNRHLNWSDGNNEISEELAEILAALTLVRHPEIKEKIKPYHQPLLDQMRGQLSLFPEKRTWYSRPHFIPFPQQLHA
ncbi:MAG: hypothetical protein AABX13_02270 [Nanoarchaeota archaeon]